MKIIGTFSSVYEDDYMNKGFLNRTCAKGLEADIFQNAHDQNGKRILVVVLLHRSKGP